MGQHRKEKSNSFYKIPKALFTDARFQNLSLEAKILYGMFLDRLSLSKKNNWKDERGQVYIIFTIETIMELFGCGNKKAGQLVAELVKVHLIEKKRQGLCKPTLIYVQDFAEKEPLQTCQNDSSEPVESTLSDVAEEQGSNTEYDLAESSYPENPISSAKDGMDSAEKTKSLLKEQLEADTLCKEYPKEKELIENILDLVTEVLCSRKKFVRIASDDKPTEFVQNRFRKLNSRHIRYVLDCLRQNTTQVRNIKTYLLTAVFNAPATMEGYAALAKPKQDTQKSASFLDGTAIDWDKLQAQISNGAL